MSDTVNKEWYVIHTYSGYENKVKDNIEKRVESLNMEDKIFRIVVPEEKETIITPTGKRKEVNSAVIPVLPPSSTPLADSRYVVMTGIQKKLPATVDNESTLKHLSISCIFPSLSSQPARFAIPSIIPIVPKKSGTKKVKIQGKYSGFNAPKISILKLTSDIPVGTLTKFVGTFVTPIGIPIIVTISIAKIRLPFIFRASSTNINKNPIAKSIDFAVVISPKFNVLLFGLATITPAIFNPINDI